MSTAIERPKTAAEKHHEGLAKNAWGLLQQMKASIAAILPKHLTPERMSMIAFTAMRQNPKLLECSKESIIGSIMTASILGLEPSGPLGHGALIPYGRECQFQPMYQGLLDLARRSGLIKDVQLRAVYKGDRYTYRFGLDPTIEHVPLEGEAALDPTRECTNVYCIIRFMNGGIQWDQMSYADALAHAKRFSKSWDRQLQKFKAESAWSEHPVSMAQKTILKRTLKLCPKSPELALAMQIDDLSEGGKMATLKAGPDGIFDVDFGGSDEPEAPAEKPNTVLDRLVNENTKSAGSTKAQGGDKGEKVSGETNAAPPAETPKYVLATNSDLDRLEILATESNVRHKAWKKHIVETMGFADWTLLDHARIGEVEAWIRANAVPAK